MQPKIKENRWDKALEKPIYSDWKKKQSYKFNEKSKKPVYSIDTPPPYVNAPIHIGQATTYVLMDMFARFKRMTGFEVLFPLGLDRNGLPIEMAAEKKFNIKLNQLSREEFLKKCQLVLEEASTESIESFLQLGISFNSWKKGKEIGEMYFTDSPEYRALTQATFIDLWKKGLIYEDKRINNFCPGCQTTLADAEIVYEEKETLFNDIKFRVKETGEEIIIATTRPELICTCAMVIFNPEDERYKHLNGKTAITPLFEKEVPIRSHPIAEKEKGSGLAMMCSAGDQDDIRFFREMKLEPKIAINVDGTMNEISGFLKGLKVKDARAKIIEELKNKNLLIAQKKILHRTPICERSKDDIEFVEMQEYYLKQLDFKKDLKKIANEMNFFAPESRQILLDWIESISMDWPISRRRFYSTEIPLWKCKKCGEAILAPKGKYVQPWKEKPAIKCCPKCKSTEFVGEQRVFDTWFDSSNSPLYILGYGRNEKFFSKNFPCTLRPQGKEIIRTWLYYSLLKSFLLFKKPVFRDAWINYHIVDEKGKKMSKSLGNMIDPQVILQKFGAEPFRLWSAVEGNLEKTDFRCSFERIEGAGKTLTKLWNVARFISMFPQPKGKGRLNELDNWIISEMNALIVSSKKSFENYDFHNPSVQLRHFLWETFASHYLELVKTRAYNEGKKFSKAEQEAAFFSLNYCLQNLLQLLSPITPFITEKLFSDLYKKEIHSLSFPKPVAAKSVFNAKEIEELNAQIWKTKKDKGLSLKAEIFSLTVPKKFKAIEKDLSLAHNAKKIVYGTKTEIELA